MNEGRYSTAAPFAVLSISLVLTCATSVNSALPAMKNELGMSYTQTELITTLPALAVVLFVLLSNKFAQWIGMKRMVQIGLSLVILGGTAPVFLTNYFLILVSRFLLGIGFGLFNSPAVSLINLMYQDEPRRRAMLLGYRGAAENLGNAGMSLLAGGLLTINWHWSFAIYWIALPILVLFSKFVPDVDMSLGMISLEKTNIRMRKKDWLSLVASAVLALFVIIGFIAIGIRFPSLVVFLKGTNYPTSIYIAVMPIISILSGTLFGFFNRVLRSKVLYLGLFIMACSTFLVGLGEKSFFCLIIGFLISGVPASLVLPFIFNSLDGFIPENKMNLATSLIIVGCNLGNFLSPFGLRGLQVLARSESLFLPFLLLTLIVVVVILSIRISFSNQKEQIQA